MQVTFWGTRGSIAKAGPTTVRYGGNTSCVSVRTDAGTLIVLDSGTGIHELGQELVRSGDRVDGHLLIGHTHWDHIQGLPFFAPLFVPGNVWHVYGPRGLDTSIDKTLASQMQYTFFPVQLLDFGATIEYHDLVEGQLEIDDVTVTTRYLHHPALTLGYRLVADGATLVYSTDHEPSVDGAPGPEGLEEETRDEAQHIAFLRGADLVIHDAQYLAAEYPEKVGWGHSTVEYAVDVAQAADVRRLALFHHDPTRTDDDVDDLVMTVLTRARAQGYTGEVFAAAEGTSITLRSVDDDDAPPVVDTARRVPALAELSRAVLMAIDAPDAAAALREAALAEGFEIIDCRDSDEVLHRVRTEQPPIVVLEALPGRSLDDLADDAVEIIESYPEGATVAYLTLTTPPANGIRPEITDWLVWPASLSHLRTKLRSWLLRRACRWQAAALPGDESAAARRTLEPRDPRHRARSPVRPLHRGRVLHVRRAGRPGLAGRRRPPVVQVPRRAPHRPFATRRVDVARTPSSATRRSWSPTRSTTTGSPTTPTCATEHGCASTPACRSPSPTVTASARCASWITARVLDDAQIERLEQLGRMVEADLESAEEEPDDPGAEVSRSPCVHRGLHLDVVSRGFVAQGLSLRQRADRFFDAEQRSGSDRLDPTAGRCRDRDGGRGRDVRELGDGHDVVVAEREVEALEVPARSLDHRADGDRTVLRPLDQGGPGISRVRGLDQVSGHDSPTSERRGRGCDVLRPLWQTRSRVPSGRSSLVPQAFARAHHSAPRSRSFWLRHSTRPEAG